MANFSVFSEISGIAAGGGDSGPHAGRQGKFLEDCSWREVLTKDRQGATTPPRGCGFFSGLPKILVTFWSSIADMSGSCRTIAGKSFQSCFWYLSGNYMRSTSLPVLGCVCLFLAGCLCLLVGLNYSWLPDEASDGASSGGGGRIPGLEPPRRAPEPVKPEEEEKPPTPKDERQEDGKAPGTDKGPPAGSP